MLKAGAANVKEGGKLITIVTSLLAAFTGYYTSYAGSKAPVEHFTRGVAKELAGKRISVNAIAPGPMDTRKSWNSSPLALLSYLKEFPSCCI
jgi:NAD(P)-dependent dehydrogenase (short-subunit alcohol dehydrogenase family)